MKLFAASLLCTILLTGCVRREYIVLHGTWSGDPPVIQIERVWTECDGPVRTTEVKPCDLVQPVVLPWSTTDPVICGCALDSPDCLKACQVQSTSELFSCGLDGVGPCVRIQPW